MEPNVTVTDADLPKPSLLGVITSPSLQFERMKQKAPIAVPMLLMALVYAVIGGLSAYFLAISPEMVNKLPADVPESAKVFTSPIFVASMGAVGAAIGTMIMFLISALFYKVCMMIMGNDTTYKKLLSISIFTSVIGVLGGLVNVILMAIFGGLDVQYTSLAPLFKSGTMLHSAAKMIEVFSIWGYVVTAIALQKAAGLRKGQAITLVVIVFAIGLGVSLLGGMASSFRFGP